MQHPEAYFNQQTGSGMGDRSSLAVMLAAQQHGFGGFGLQQQQGMPSWSHPGAGSSQTLGHGLTHGTFGHASGPHPAQGLNPFAAGKQMPTGELSPTKCIESKLTSLLFVFRCGSINCANSDQFQSTFSPALGCLCFSGCCTTSDLFWVYSCQPSPAGSRKDARLRVTGVQATSLAVGPQMCHNGWAALLVQEAGTTAASVQTRFMDMTPSSRSTSS